MAVSVGLHVDSGTMYHMATSEYRNQTGFPGREASPDTRLKDIREIVCTGESTHDVQLALFVCQQIFPDASCKGMLLDRNGNKADCSMEVITSEIGGEVHESVPKEGRYSFHSPSGEAICLSARECQVASLTANGMTCKEIAWELGVKESTVAAHRRNIYRKTGLSSSSQLAAWVVRSEIG
ncbi:helix-turn-helix transcriptional regulator [Parasphaerochaeta coccoides]|uniref:Transcriptional regulator, LuxR family n=1 Tax=Parasphaerochaeta coccoides (strain ATCC BAA-1237 / DSM 17374 / SPN1) TaxID=760011 RepID=F4GHZ8_PARC1|nr:helix-turn-helix transcriptional regulator [Parasphaerochaeta coccoides]AEC02111.1 transcriptional regulator, LuxR family [Parasphaerochaeta coccoides DSM 17374]